jgi:type I restriction enzyme S subunit
MTGQQLKSSILQMAVQGKLVPQDPNDEPASVLLERIRKEKEQLIKDGKIKKEKNPSYIFRGADNLPYEKVGKNEPVCIADQVPFEIPESWEWVRLGSIFSIEMGQSPAGNTVSEKNIGIEFHQGKMFFGDKYINLSGKYTSSPTKYAPKNSVLLCVRAPVGKVNITNRKLCIGRGLCAIIPLAGMPLLFVYYLLAAYENIFVKQATGTTFVAITAETVKNQLIPLPPFAEQIRIAEQIEKLIPVINEYRKVEDNIKKLNDCFPELLKKSILQEAVQGKLVPQDPTDEPASVLLERIRAEKERLIQEGKIKRDKHESVIYRRDNSHYEKRGSEEICIDDEIPFELPNGWRWCRFSTICYKLTDGSHNPPPKRAKGFRVISARNIKNGRILFTDEDRLCDQNGFNKENPRTQISKGDVILGIIGGSIGNTAIYGYDEPVIAQRSIAIFGSSINNKYMKLLLDSPLFQQQFNSKSNGTAQGGIYLGELANMLVPLPPVNEQNRILASLSSLENKIVTM